MRRQNANGEAGETVRLRATWVVEYDADPAHYDYDDTTVPATPQEMAEMDGRSDDPIALMADADTVSFTVEAVQS